MAWITRQIIQSFFGTQCLPPEVQGMTIGAGLAAADLQVSLGLEHIPLAYPIHESDKSGKSIRVVEDTTDDLKKSAGPFHGQGVPVPELDVVLQADVIEVRGQDVRYLVVVEPAVRIDFPGVFVPGDEDLLPLRPIHLRGVGDIGDHERSGEYVTA